MSPNEQTFTSRASSWYSGAAIDCFSKNIVGSIPLRSHPTDYFQKVDEPGATGHRSEEVRKRGHGAQGRLLQGTPAVEAVQIHDGEHITDQRQTLSVQCKVKSHDRWRCELPWSI